MTFKAAVLGLAAILTTPAFAQTASADAAQTRAELEANMRARLGAADANKDGTVTADEVRAAMQARARVEAGEAFVAMDADKSGQVSRAEYDAYIAGQLTGPRFAGGRMAGMGFSREMAAGLRSGGIVIADAVADSLQRFDATDANKDGTVTPAERRAMRDRLRAAGGGRQDRQGSGEQPEQDQ